MRRCVWPIGAECGAKGLGLVARRDLDNADVRALTMQFQACGDAVFAQLSAHPSRFQAGGVQGLLYAVGALVNSGASRAPLRLPKATPRLGARERLVFHWELKRPKGTIRAGQELLADYSW